MSDVWLSPICIYRTETIVYMALVLIIISFDVQLTSDIRYHSHYKTNIFFINIIYDIRIVAYYNSNYKIIYYFLQI